MSYINAEDLKVQLSITDVVSILSLEVKDSGNQMRGQCPLCDSEDPRKFVVTKDAGTNGLWYSFCCKEGGDQIKLYSLVKGISFKDALAELAGQSGGLPDSPPESTDFIERKYLVFDHPAVQVLGFTPEIAEQLGIGFAPKGAMKDTVLIPIRLPNGKLVGYVGATDLLLPKEFHL